MFDRNLNKLHAYYKAIVKNFLSQGLFMAIS